MAKPFSRTVTVAVTSTVVFGPNPRRVGLVLSAPAANRVSFAFGEPAILDAGITLHATQAPITLHKDTCGFDVTQQINAIASVQSDVGVTELINP